MVYSVVVTKKQFLIKRKAGIDMKKKEREDAFVVLYTLFLIITFPVWILFYVMKAMK